LERYVAWSRDRITIETCHRDEQLKLSSEQLSILSSAIYNIRKQEGVTLRTKNSASLTSFPKEAFHFPGKVLFWVWLQIAKGSCPWTQALAWRTEYQLKILSVTKLHCVGLVSWAKRRWVWFASIWFYYVLP